MVRCAANRLRSIAGTAFRWSRTRSPPMAVPRFVLRPPSGTRPASPRALFISVYGAGDAVPCAPGPLPGMHEDRFVRGGNPDRVRAEDYEIDFPKTPFFTQQLEQERLA